jgi:hypothetical protein
MAVSRLRGRLRRLETRLTDVNGLRPQSPEWWEHWARRLQSIFSGEEPGEPGCIPLDVWDAIEAADQNQTSSGTQNLAHMTTVGRHLGAEVTTDIP